MNPSANHPRNILVTLRHRDDIIAAFKNYNKTHKPDFSNDNIKNDNFLNSMHLDIPSGKCKIYVVEHLSPETKELYAVTRR